MNIIITLSMQYAATTALPRLKVTARKPWIRNTTLELMQLRNNARSSSQTRLEQELNQKIKAAAKQDRAQWIEQMLESGDWKAIKNYRKGPRRCPGRLRDAQGQLVSTEQRADTMATYLADMVWKIPLPTLCAPGTTSTTLPIDTGIFLTTELTEVLTRFRRARSPGHDGI